MKDDIIYNKAYKFALRIINAYLFLNKKKQEYVLSKQLLRSGTAIGALISESRLAQSKPDLYPKCILPSKRQMKPNIG